MPRVPPAPPRFSTMIDWPSSTPRGSKSARGTISVALPAANGMNARIGLDGQGWASAALEPRAIAAAMIAGYQQDFMSCVLIQARSRQVGIINNHAAVRSRRIHLGAGRCGAQKNPRRKSEPVVRILMIASLFFFYGSGDHRDLHSFPTRRSSDLGRDSEIDPADMQKFTDFALQIILPPNPDRKSTRLNSSHVAISYAVFCLKKKKKKENVDYLKKKREAENGKKM